MGQSRVDSRAHIPSLDGLRGLAMSMILLFHTTGVQPGGILESSLYYTIRNFFWGSLDLFFALSGFLITGILLDSRGREGYFRNFLARRVLRIFPVYYLYLVVFFAVAPQFVDVDRFLGGDGIYYWVYLQNFAQAAAGEWAHSNFLNHFWSLAVEEHFYLLWPWIVLWAGRRRLLGICAVLVVATLAVRLTLHFSGVPPVSIYVVTPCRLDGLAMGSAVAALARGPGGLEALVPWARALGGVALAAIAGITWWQGGSFLYVEPLSITLGFTFLALLWSSMLVLVVTGSHRPAWRWLESRFLRMVGRYSYTLYVVHEGVRVLFLAGLYRWVLQPYWPDATMLELQGIVYVGVSTIALAIAATVWRLYEKPLLDLKRYFPSGRPMPPGYRAPSPGR